MGIKFKPNINSATDGDFVPVYGDGADSFHSQINTAEDGTGNFIPNGTKLVYRGIELSNCLTREFSQEIVYDMSGTDMMYQKFTIAVVGYVHDQFNVTNLGTTLHHSLDMEGSTGDPYKFGDLDDNAKNQMADSGPWAASFRLRYLHMWLGVPRGILEYWHEDHQILFCRGAGGEFGYEEDATQDSPKNLWQKIEEDPDWAGADEDARKAYIADLERYDVRNGPKPKHIKVTHVAGQQCYRVEFTIEVNKLVVDQTLIDQIVAIKPADIQNAGDDSTDYGRNYVRNEHLMVVLSNRWRIEDSRDKNFMWRKIVSGRLEVRTSKILIDELRYLCVPQMIRSFQRESMDFTVSEDGLSMTYKIVDQQRYAAPPMPAVDWRASQSDSVESYKPVAITTLRVWLRGAPNCNKQDLLLSAWNVVEHRLGSMRDGDGDDDPANNKMGRKVIPINFIQNDTLHEPEIELIVTVKRFFPKGNGANEANNAQGDLVKTGQVGKFANVMLQEVGKLPARNPQEAASADPDTKVKYLPYALDSWPNPLNYDSNRPVGLLKYYLQHPALRVKAIPAGYDKRWIAGVPNEQQANPEDPRRTSGGAFSDPYSTLQPEYLHVVSTDDGSGGPAGDYWVSRQAYFDGYDNYSLTHADAPYVKTETECKYQTSMNKTCHAQSNSQFSVFTRLGASGGETYRTYWIKATRIGKWPEMPKAPEYIDAWRAPGTSGSASFDHPPEVLVDLQIAPLTPELQADGVSHTFTIEYMMTYACVRPPTESERLKSGTIPWDNLDIANANFVNKTTYKRDLWESNAIIQNIQLEDTEEEEES